MNGNSMKVELSLNADENSAKPQKKTLEKEKKREKKLPKKDKKSKVSTINESEIASSHAQEKPSSKKLLNCFNPKNGSRKNLKENKHPRL